MSRFKKEITLIVTITGYVFLSGIVFFNSLPYNPLKSEHKNSISIQSVFPEGWAFFTRDPREEQIYIYKYNPKTTEYTPVDRIKNAHYSNWFGFDKSSRYRMVELAKIFQEIPEKNWQETRFPREFKPDSIIPKIYYDFPIKTFSGYYIFQKKKPLPWAWRKSEGKTIMPSSVVIVNLISKDTK